MPPWAHWLPRPAGQASAPPPCQCQAPLRVVQLPKPEPPHQIPAPTHQHSRFPVAVKVVARQRRIPALTPPPTQPPTPRRAAVPRPPTAAPMRRPSRSLTQPVSQEPGLGQMRRLRLSEGGRGQAVAREVHLASALQRPHLLVRLEPRGRHPPRQVHQLRLGWVPHRRLGRAAQVPARQRVRVLLHRLRRSRFHIHRVRGRACRRLRGRLLGRQRPPILRRPSTRRPPLPLPARCQRLLPRR